LSGRSVSRVLALLTGRNDGEFEALIRSAGWEIVGRLRVRRRSSSHWIGKGKLEEVKGLVQELSPDIVAINADLRSAQWYNLRKELGVEVLDRLGVILRIFRDRASSREAKLQVELAILRYEIPHVKEYVRRVRMGEHPGFMGGGEYGIEPHVHEIRRRIARIRRELEKVRADRRRKRERRRELGFRLVAVVGYANAGKSTLVRALTGKDVPVDDRMFTTLQVATGRMCDGVLVTDTVGLVSDLPPWVLEAFKAAIEEAVEADAIVVVVDASEPVEEVGRKAQAIYEILSGMGLEKPVILALNKVDAADGLEEKARILIPLFGRVIPISALRGDGLPDLRREIFKVLGLVGSYEPPMYT